MDVEPLLPHIIFRPGIVLSSFPHSLEGSVIPSAIRPVHYRRYPLARFPHDEPDSQLLQSATNDPPNLSR